MSDTKSHWQSEEAAVAGTRTYLHRSMKQTEWRRGIGFMDVDCFFKTFELALFDRGHP